MTKSDTTAGQNLRHAALLARPAAPRRDDLRKVARTQHHRGHSLFDSVVSGAKVPVKASSKPARISSLELAARDRAQQLEDLLQRSVDFNGVLSFVAELPEALLPDVVAKVRGRLFGTLPTEGRDRSRKILEEGIGIDRRGALVAIAAHLLSELGDLEGRLVSSSSTASDELTLVLSERENILLAVYREIPDDLIQSLLRAVAIAARDRSHARWYLDAASRRNEGIESNTLHAQDLQRSETLLRRYPALGAIQTALSSSRGKDPIAQIIPSEEPLRALFEARVDDRHARAAILAKVYLLTSTEPVLAILPLVDTFGAQMINRYKQIFKGDLITTLAQRLELSLRSKCEERDLSTRTARDHIGLRLIRNAARGRELDFEELGKYALLSEQLFAERITLATLQPNLSDAEVTREFHHYQALIAPYLAKTPRFKEVLNREFEERTALVHDLFAHD